MTTKSRLSWRINEIVIASVIAVVCALIFVLWNLGIYPIIETTLAVTAPQFTPIIGGGWLIGGTLGGLLIRKPGAALYCELLAAIISAFIGSGGFGPTVIISGIIQGLAAELIFALFLYRAWTLPISILAGAVSGAAMSSSELIIYYAGEFAPAHQATYIACGTISGAIIAGTLIWFLAQALAKTGVLDSLASGAAHRRATR